MCQNPYPLRQNVGHGFANATRLPVKVSDPIRIEITMAVGTTPPAIGTPPPTALAISLEATSVEAMPPSPFSKATIWGMAVI